MTASELRLCDRCRNPGRCCTGFALNFINQAQKTELEILIDLARVTHGTEDGRRQIGVPFMPLLRLPDGVWRFWCPLLGRDGRCTDYANRPEPCWRYEAGSDGLCCEYQPPSDIKDMAVYVAIDPEKDFTPQPCLP